MSRPLSGCTPGELVAMLVEHANARARLIARLAEVTERIDAQVEAIDHREGEIEALLARIVAEGEPRALLVKAYWDAEACRYVDQPHMVDLRLEDGSLLADIVPLEPLDDLDWPDVPVIVPERTRPDVRLAGSDSA